MKPKTMILMVVAIGCGLGASYMTSKLLAERDAKNSQAEPTVPVLVAKARVAAGHPIKEPEQQFEIKQFPQSVAPKRALGNFAELKDQRLKAPMEEGKSVLQDDLVSKETASLEHMLQAGQRAISIKVNAESSIAGFVLPGSRVDIVHTIRNGEPSATVMLQNMLVLAVDANDSRNGEQKTILGQTVTLAASVEEATKLSLATSNGELRLLLKSATDTARVETPMVKGADLNKPQTPKQPEADPATRPTGLGQALPEIPEEEKPTAPEKPKATTEVKAVKKDPPHVLVIRNGMNVDKTTFRKPRPEGEDEDGTDPDAAPEERPDAKPKANGAIKAPAKRK